MPTSGPQSWDVAWGQRDPQSLPYALVKVTQLRDFTRLSLLRDDLDENGGNRVLKRRPVAKA
jgi:hypothetical protein